MSLDSTVTLGWLADHATRVGVLVMFAGAGLLLARKASAHSRLFLWTVVLHVAVAMPLLTTVLPDLPWLSAFTDPVIVISTSTALGGSARALTPSAATSWPTFGAGLLILYGIGTVILLSRIVIGWHLTARLLRSARVVDDAALAAELQSLSGTLSPSHAPRVVESDSVHVPFVCGVRRSTLVLPASWRAWDADTRHAVLAHELSHLARKDVQTMHVALVYRAVMWANPISWWLRRRIETLAECASDEAVLASGVEATTYADALVRFFEAARLSPGRATWGVAMARPDGRGGAEAARRIARVLETKEKTVMGLTFARRVMVAAGVVMVAVPTAALVAGQPQVAEVQSAPVVHLEVEPPNVAVKPLLFHGGLPAKPDVKVPVVSVPDLPVILGQDRPRDVVMPKVVTRVHPKYTPQALREKIQGRVTVKAVVGTDGLVESAVILESLDTEFGLDEAALAAARQWTFVPGTFQGAPTAVAVVIELEFRLH